MTSFVVLAFDNTWLGCSGRSLENKFISQVMVVLTPSLQGTVQPQSGEVPVGKRTNKYINKTKIKIKLYLPDIGGVDTLHQEPPKVRKWQLGNQQKKLIKTIIGHIIVV